MNNILSYSLAVSILLLILAPVIQLIISRCTYHRFNRIILLSSVTTCFLLPAILVVIDSFEKTGNIIPELTITLNDVTMLDKFGNIAKSDITGINIISLITYIYFSGIAIFSIYLIMAFIRVRKLIGDCQKEKLSGHTLCIHNDRHIAPFSFMNYIVMSEADYQSGFDAIWLHECAHIEKHHWIDVIYMDIVTALLWYNPIAWILRDKLRQIHEYEADRAVIEHGIAAADYQKLLIVTAIDRRTISLTNGFSSRGNNFRRRIKMIGTTEINSKQRYFALLLIPACAIAVAAVNNNVSSKLFSTISNSNLVIPKTELPEKQPVIGQKAEGKNHTIVLPSPIVNQKPLAERISYTISCSTFNEDLPDKKVMLSLSVDEEGKIVATDVDPKIPGLTETINESLNQVEFEVYTDNGTPIKLQLKLPLLIKGKK